MWMILNMKKMARTEMNHPLEKMKILEMNHHKKKMERRAMTFQMEKKMIIEKMKMIMMMAMMGKP